MSWCNWHNKPGLDRRSLSPRVWLFCLECNSYRMESDRWKRKKIANVEDVAIFEARWRFTTPTSNNVRQKFDKVNTLVAQLMNPEAVIIPDDLERLQELKKSFERAVGPHGAMVGWDDGQIYWRLGESGCSIVEFVLETQRVVDGCIRLVNLWWSPV